MPQHTTITLHLTRIIQYNYADIFSKLVTSIINR